MDGLYTDKIMYGSAPATLRVTFQDIGNMYSKESPVLGLGYHGKKKEKDMDVGGNRCHLCGAPIEYKDVEVYYSKFGDDGVANRVRTYTHIEYECGTHVGLIKSRKGCVEKDKSPRVTVGKSCIKVPAA